MNQLIRELTADLQQQHYEPEHYCECQQQIQFEIPIVYTLNGQQTFKVNSFLDEQDSEDVRSKLLRYNPSLSQYLNNPTTITYTPSGYLNTNNPPDSTHNQPINLSINSHRKYSSQKNNTSNNFLIENQSQTPIDQNQSEENNQSNEQKIQNYISSMKDTREMADTKFKKYFNKPCFANYGAYNTKMENGGIVYGQYMKTHNISPHKNGNRPPNYETYQSALLHANRTILNQSKDKKQIIKQIARKQRQEIQSNNRINGIQQPPSRLGLDGTQNTHKTSRTNKSKSNASQSIIQKERVKQKDKHIAQTQHHNYENKLKYDYPDHHLLPLANKQIYDKKKPTASTIKSIKLQKEQTRQNTNKQFQQPSSYRIVELAHAETQTFEPSSRQMSTSPKLQKIKHQQSLTTPKSIPKNNSESKLVEFYSIQIKQPEPILVMRPPTSPSGKPKQLNVKQSYSYKEQFMPAPYQYCICKHKECQHKTKLKHQAILKGIKDPEVGERIISCAKIASMYNNYLPNMSSIENCQVQLNHPENKEIKSYYNLPRQRMNPQNYKCRQVEELQEIPYAGKPLRYNFNNS